MLIITIVAIILQYIHALPCLTPYIYIPLFVQYILIKKKKRIRVKEGLGEAVTYQGKGEHEGHSQIQGKGQGQVEDLDEVQSQGQFHDQYVGGSGL